MLIAPTSVLRVLQEAIVKATHGLVNQDGEPMTLGTVNERQLAMAALNAISSAAGDVVWPGDRRIDPPKRVRDPGPFGEW